MDSAGWVTAQCFGRASEMAEPGHRVEISELLERNQGIRLDKIS